MKKLIKILLTILMLLTFAACNDNGGDTPNDRPAPNVGADSISAHEGDPESMANPEPTTTAVGDIIEFGGYDWRVLDARSDKMLIISEKVFENQSYHGAGGDITWEHSSIREYLNGELFDSFSESDKARIVETTLINKDNPDGYEEAVPGGNDTTDKIFLLSVDEANSYFEDDSARVAYYENGAVAERWWLRSPGAYRIYASYVITDGSVYVDGYFVNFHMGGGVRPAMWITTED